jgi:hypothetical protein
MPLLWHLYVRGPQQRCVGTRRGAHDSAASVWPGNWADSEAPRPHAARLGVCGCMRYMGATVTLGASHMLDGANLSYPHIRSAQLKNRCRGRNSGLQRHKLSAIPMLLFAVRARGAWIQAMDESPNQCFQEGACAHARACAQRGMSRFVK